MHALPPLECLRFFDAAARHESFVRAADELQVTAAAVAHRIRVLEAHLRAPLFHRRHRGVRLTGSGNMKRDPLSTRKQRASRRGPGFSTGAPGPPFHRPGA